MSHDTLLHRAVRPVARRLARTGVHPNHVSALRLATATAAASCFARGGRRAVAAGCGLFTVSAALDRVDGELARQTGRFSTAGHRLDLAGDLLADALAFVGLGIGARRGPLGAAAPWLGAAAALGVGALFWQLNGGEARPGPRPRRLADPDDAALAIPALLLTAGAEPVLVLAGLVTPLAAVLARRRRWRL